MFGNFIALTIATLVLIALFALAVVLIRFNQKRLHIIRDAKTATNEQIETIYSEIERLITCAPSSAVLARTNRRSEHDGEIIIPVPSYIQPWAGRVISINVGSDVQFQFSSTSASEPVFLGKVFRFVPVPRHPTKAGKLRNQFVPKQYVKNNPRLLEALKAVSPSYPMELLCYLLAVGCETFEFDSINQARVGGSPAWVQDADFPNCEECNKRMTLILQVPGTLFSKKAFRNETFYLFGCVKHPSKIKNLSQLS